MPSLKLTKTAVETARPEARDYELRDTTLPGFICKVTPAGRKVFMLSYRTPTGERRNPSLGVFGVLTVDQARKLAQEHLAPPPCVLARIPAPNGRRYAARRL